MKKKLFILLAVSLVSLYALGQSISKQINDIKRNSQYICAEATMQTEAEAYELADELLAKQISEFVSDHKSLKKATNVIVKDVAGKAEKIQMNRGAMTRVFLYVKKSDIIAADNTRVLVQAADSTESAVLSDVGETNNRIDLIDESFVSQVEEVEVSDSCSNVEVGYVDDLGLPFKWQEDLIKELLDCSNKTDAIELMKRLRAERKLKRYGAANTCPNPERSFWLIIDDKENVVTILGEGNSERTNFRSLTKDSLDKYSGMGAIWFTMSK